MDHRLLYGTVWRADDRRHRGLQYLRPTTHLGRRGARSPHRLALRQRARRDRQDRRPGDEERHRPRSCETALRQSRHARRDHGSDVQGVAASGLRRDIGALWFADGKAVAALCAAQGTPLSVSAAAHLPAGLATPEPLTLFRLEGPQASVDERLSALRRALAPFESGEALAPDYAVRCGRPSVMSCRSCRRRTPPSGVFQSSRRVRPNLSISSCGSFRRAITTTGAAASSGYRLRRRAMPARRSSARALKEAGNGQTIGHATLVRAPDDVRNRVDVFEPLAAPLHKLTRDIKSSFDPDGILNPGRMYAGI